MIVNYRTPALAMACLQRLSVEHHAGELGDAILVDGHSDDGSADLLRQTLAGNRFCGWVDFLPLNFNGGFGWANNQAIRKLLSRPDAPEFIYLVNPDAAPEPLALAQLVEALRSSPDAGAAGSLLLGDDAMPLGSAFRFPSPVAEFLRGANTPALDRMLRRPPALQQRDETAPADWVTGASVLLRSATLREIGLFDEGFFLYFEEVELMHRMQRAGWKCLHVPASRVRHAGGASTGVGNGSALVRRMPDYWFRSRRRFLTLAYGRVGAMLSSAAWLAGLCVWTMRCKIGLGRAGGHAPSEARDLLRNGIVPTAADGRGEAAAWNSPSTAFPAWKERQ